jgi:hypothetical protein
MVAGDHFDADAGAGAGCHCRYRLIPGRIDDTDPGEQGKTAFQIRKADFSPRVLDQFSGYRQDTQSARSEFLRAAMPIAGIQYSLTLPEAALAIAHLQNTFWSAFDENEAAAFVVVVEGRHQPVFGFERDGVGTRQRLALPDRICAGFDGECEQGALGRIARHLPGAVGEAVELRIVAKHGGARNFGQFGVVFGHDGRILQLNPAVGFISHADDIEDMAGGSEFLYRHFVPGQRAGLVRANDRDRA